MAKVDVTVARPADEPILIDLRTIRLSDQDRELLRRIAVALEDLKPTPKPSKAVMK